MTEPEWVYVQRRQRLAVAAAMVVGAIVMIAVVASTLSSGFSVDLDGPAPKTIAKPDVDEVLAREKRQIDAQKERKADRRRQRAEERRHPPKPRKPKSDTAPPRATTPAATPQRSAPAPDPAPASTPNPATAPAPAAPQPSAPAQPAGGGVDPRFY